MRLDVATFWVALLTLVATIVGIFVTVALYRREVGRQKRLREGDEREARIARFFNDYRERVLHTNAVPSLVTAKDARIWELHNDEEVREALRRISPPGGTDVMYGDLSSFDEVDLLAVLRFVQEHRLRLDDGPRSLRRAMNAMEHDGVSFARRPARKPRRWWHWRR